jgi:hypothetical protein
MNAISNLDHDARPTLEIGGIIAAMAHGTSDDRACREPAKRPGYDSASILRKSGGRRCRQGRPKRQGCELPKLLIAGLITFL